MEKEIYKKIEGYEKSYMVSNFGNVKSLERLVPNNKNSGLRKIKECILKPKIKYNGYREVKFGKKMFYVHRLVVQTFIGNINNGFNVNHKDGNKSNNNLKNLEITTFSQNSIHAINNKLLLPPPPMKGSKHPRANVNEKGVIDLSNFYKDNGLKNTTLKYPNIPRSTICKIVYRHTWKHI